jgi:hypothetical protein
MRQAPRNATSVTSRRNPNSFQSKSIWPTTEEPAVRFRATASPSRCRRPAMPPPCRAGSCTMSQRLRVCGEDARRTYPVTWRRAPAWPRVWRRQSGSRLAGGVWGVPVGALAERSGTNSLARWRESKRKAPFPGPFRVAGRDLNPRPPGYEFAPGGSCEVRLAQPCGPKCGQGAPGGVGLVQDLVQDSCLGRQQTLV